MLSYGRAAWLAALLGATTASAAACTTDLLVDDFSSVNNSTNKLGSAIGGRLFSRHRLVVYEGKF
jgi:hypothetical protein